MCYDHTTLCFSVEKLILHVLGHVGVETPGDPEPSTTKNSSSSRAQKSSPAKLAQRTNVCEMR